MKITKQTLVEMELTPYDLGIMFWNQMNAQDQAIFFNTIASQCGPISLAQQMQSVRSDEILTRDGRRVMQKIGEYGED